jgi:predicted PurR-regulated permease PerM
MRSTRPLSPRIADRRLWEIQPLRDLAWLLAIAGSLWLLFDFRQLFAPVLLAFVVAYVCDPVMQVVATRSGVPRWILALVLTLTLILGVVLLVTWVGPLLTEQVQTLASKVPQYVSTVEKRYGVKIGTVSEHLATFAKGLKANPVETLSPFFTGTSQAVGILGTILAGTMEILLSALLLPIFFFLFAWHFDRLRLDLGALIADGRGARVHRTLHRMDQAVSGFVRGRLLIALIAMVGFTVGWSWTEVPYALLLGIVTGLLTIVPYLSLAGWPIALLVKYIDVVSSSGTPAWTDVVIWPSVVFVLVAVLEGWVLTPWIQSQAMDMSALTILLAVLVGGAVGGVLGLILAIPVTACGKIALEEFRGPTPRLLAVPNETNPE